VSSSVASDALRYPTGYGFTGATGPSSQEYFYPHRETPEGPGFSSSARAGLDALRNTSYGPIGPGEGSQWLVDHARSPYPGMSNAFPYSSRPYGDFPVDMRTPAPAQGPRFLQQGWPQGERSTPAPVPDNLARQSDHARETAPKKTTIDITNLQPTRAHLDAEALYQRDYNGKGGMKRMKQEHPEQAWLMQKVGAMGNWGTAEQRTALNELRAQRAMRAIKGELAYINNEPVAPQQQEQAESSLQEMERVRQQSYGVYQAIYQSVGEAGLHQMQQDYPATYETAVSYLQEMSEYGERFR